MARTIFKLRIVTPHETIVDDDVTYVSFRGLDGEYGILAHHAPLLTATEPGVVTVEQPDGSRDTIVVTEGFAEVRDNTLSLICEAGERAGDIDLERAREAEQRARDQLAHRATLAEADVLKAEAALRRALTRQLAAKRSGTRA